MREHLRFRCAFLSMSLVALAGSSASSQEPAKRVVAVVAYDNNSGDGRYDHLGRAFSSMMISDLSVIDRIDLVERERLEEVLGELDLQHSAYADPESAQDLGMIVGAEYLVTGAFITVDPEIRVDTRIDRVETSEIVTTAEVTGEQESLFDLQERLADQVVQGLELVLTEDEQQRLREQQEANRIDDLETMVEFSRGLCLLDGGSYVEGLEQMQEVRQRAPNSQIVGATLELLRGHAEEAGRSRVTNEVNRRLGGLLGRSQPAPTRSGATC